MKKRLLLLLIPLLALPSAMRADEQHSLIISFHEGDSVAIVLAHKPCATFINDSLRVETTSFSATYLRSAIADFRFGWYDPTATDINGVEEDMVRIVYTDEDRVEILGIDPTLPIAVYGINGRRMETYATWHSNGITIDLTAYPVDIYLININNTQTFKIIKK